MSWHRGETTGAPPPHPHDILEPPALSAASPRQRFDSVAAGRAIAAESKLEDPQNAFDRMIIGGDRVRLDIPLRDPGQAKQHLQMLRGTIDECLLLIERAGGKDRNILFDIRTRIRIISKRINCYKKIRSL